MTTRNVLIAQVAFLLYQYKGWSDAISAHVLRTHSATLGNQRKVFIC